MKGLFRLVGLTSAAVLFVAANTGFAQGIQKPGCPKTACFDNMDTDKNGQISEAEFLEKCKGRFASMDTDKDGSLSKDEFKPCCMVPMGHPPLSGKGTGCCPYVKKESKE